MKRNITNKKKPEWIISDYSWYNYDEDQIASHMNAICDGGYEVFKISEFPIRTTINKKLNNYNNGVCWDDVSLGNGDELENTMWTRVYFQRKKSE